MRHFVAYHNEQKMGRDARPLTVVTNRRGVDDMIGDVIWVIVGTGTSPKTYFLGSRFVVDKVEPSDVSGFDHKLTGVRRSFERQNRLNDLEWFPDFLNSQQNFSLGLREIRDGWIQELERIAQLG